jgi:hypothetical protein
MSSDGDWDKRDSHAPASYLIDNWQTPVAAGEIASGNATEGHRGHVPLFTRPARLDGRGLVMRGAYVNFGVRTHFFPGR